MTIITIRVARRDKVLLTLLVDISIGLEVASKNTKKSCTFFYKTDYGQKWSKTVVGIIKIYVRGSNNVGNR